MTGPTWRDATYERCAECGFTGHGGDAPEFSAAVGAEVGGLIAAVRRSGDPTRRPSPGTWSPLEYAAHLRDVLLVQRERVLLALVEDTPAPPSMHRDERVDHDGYADQDPEDVLRQLADAAALFANVVNRLGTDADRTLVYTYPRPRVRTLAWVALHTLHEVVHHALDVRRGLRRA